MDLFVYGTLLHDPLFVRVAGAVGGIRQKASLRDHVVLQAARSELPVLVARPDGVADGAIWSGLTADQRARLESYEVAFGYSARPLVVTRADGTRALAMVYLPPATDVAGADPWSFARWRDGFAAVACLAADELQAHQPALSPPDLLRQWPMIAGRAEAIARAQATCAPATRRHAPDSFTVANAAPLTGGFFKLATLDITHRRFDGGMAGPLRREALVGCDAALLLPYDPARDRVLLVEQFRTGPARRGDPNPWSLEPVAGIVDAGETPAEAALREAVEEAGLSDVTLRPMFSFYPSPGSSTDHFHCFAGLTDLPDLSSYAGGLAEEAEDLRLHVLPLDEALSLIDTGEINAGPLIAMLLWTTRAKARGDLQPAP